MFRSLLRLPSTIGERFCTMDDIDDMVLEGIEEHHIVKWLLSELEVLADVMTEVKGMA